jgi:hypothetical protein
LVVLSSVAVSEKSLLANAIDRNTLVLERTQAHRQQAIAPALDPSRAYGQVHCTLTLDRTYTHFQKSASADQKQLSKN